MRYTPPWVDIWEVHVWEMYVWKVHVWKVQLACECMRYMGNFDFRFWQSGTVTYLICRYRRRVERVPKTAPKGVVFCHVFTGTETYTVPWVCHACSVSLGCILVVRAATSIVDPMLRYA
jgi:hypothetical protein